MVKKAIFQMKAGKALGPSGVVVAMIQAADVTGASMIHDLARENHLCQMAKYSQTGSRVSMSASTSLIRQVVSIDDSQFGFVPDRCNLCHHAAARKASSCQQETLHGFCRTCRP